MRHPPSSQRRAALVSAESRGGGRCGIHPAAAGGNSRQAFRMRSGRQTGEGGRFKVLPHRRAGPIGGSLEGRAHAVVRAVRPAVRLSAANAGGEGGSIPTQTSRPEGDAAQPAQAEQSKRMPRGQPAREETGPRPPFPAAASAAPRSA